MRSTKLDGRALLRSSPAEVLALLEVGSVGHKHVIKKGLEQLAEGYVSVTALCWGQRSAPVEVELHIVHRNKGSDGSFATPASTSPSSALPASVPASMSIPMEQQFFNSRVETRSVMSFLSSVPAVEALDTSHLVCRAPPCLRDWVTLKQGYLIKTKIAKKIKKSTKLRSGSVAGDVK